jgi:acyl-CoA synthetase (AMP-forming)/AMP-acid ligase II
VVEICEAALMVGEARLLDALDGASSQAVERTVLQRVKRLSSKDLFEKLVGEMAAVTIDESEPAFIQFTSGSTSEPKGVVISQRAALANCEYIAERIGLTPDDVGCSWLPLFHDMGLIGHVLVPLLVGTRSVLLPPEVFARQPRTWLEAVTQYRATIITAPNSAYDVCSSKIAERDLATLDLSSVRAALCGAEPILATTLQRFQARFGRAGFRSTSFVPVYGLAEATLAVALAQCDQQLRIERLDRDALQTRGHAVSRPVDDADVAGSCVDLVSVGRARRVGEVRIVDDHGQPVPERQVGSIEVAGPSVMSGYFTDAAASREALRDGFVRTGDLGFLAEGELFVVGRSKETIIKGGRNLYPYDIEAAASQVEGIRAGRVAAFGIRNATTGTEDLVVVCETKWPRSRHKELARAVTAAVFAATAIRIDTLRLVEPGVLLKTSSGKLRRNAVRERLENGTLQRMSASWSSRVGAVLAKVRRWGGRGGERRG